jgi:hypothetical protein
LDTGLGSVNSYTDPTREALNPVTGKPIPDTKAPFQPGFAASERPEKTLQVQPSLALQGIGARTYLAPPLGKPTSVPLVEQRGLHSMKVQIEMPRRSY